MTAVVLAGLVVLVGALVQGAVGYGMALLAAPLLALVDPALVPLPLLLVTSVHAILAVAREIGQADWRAVGWATLGRLPGTVLGVLAVTLLPQRGLAAVVGFAVLVFVGLSLVSWHPQPVARSLVLAGVASGAAGTATSIGGPPIALLYQNAAGPQVRATLGAYFAIGTVPSIAGLALAGQMSTDVVRDAAVLVPFLVLGFLLSGPARKILDGGRTRAAVLIVAAASAVLLLVTALV